MIFPLFALFVFFNAFFHVQVKANALLNDCQNAVQIENTQNIDLKDDLDITRGLLQNLTTGIVGAIEQTLIQSCQNDQNVAQYAVIVREGTNLLCRRLANIDWGKSKLVAKQITQFHAKLVPKLFSRSLEDVPFTRDFLLAQQDSAKQAVIASLKLMIDALEED